MFFDNFTFLTNFGVIYSKLRNCSLLINKQFHSLHSLTMPMKQDSAIMVNTRIVLSKQAQSQKFKKSGGILGFSRQRPRVGRQIPLKREHILFGTVFNPMNCLFITWFIVQWCGITYFWLRYKVLQVSW